MPLGLQPWIERGRLSFQVGGWAGLGRGAEGRQHLGRDPRPPMSAGWLCPVRCRRLWRRVPSQTRSSPRYAWAPTPWQEGPRNRNSIEVRREEKPPGLPLTSSEDGGSCLQGGEGGLTAVGPAQLCLPAKGIGRDGSVCPAGPPDAAAQGGGLPRPPSSPPTGMHSCLAAGVELATPGVC